MQMNGIRLLIAGKGTYIRADWLIIIYTTVVYKLVRDKYSILIMFLIQFSAKPVKTYRKKLLFQHDRKISPAWWSHLVEIK